MNADDELGSFYADDTPDVRLFWVAILLNFAAWALLIKGGMVVWGAVR